MTNQVETSYYLQKLTGSRPKLLMMLLLISIIHVISLAVLATKGFSHDYSGSEFDEICSSESLKNSIGVSITLSGLILLYIQTIHTLKNGKLDIVPLVCLRSLSVASLIFIVYMCYLWNWCSDRSNQIGISTGVLYQLLFNISYHMAASTGILALSTIKPHCFGYRHVICFVVLCSLQQITSFISKRYISDLFNQAVILAYYAFLVYFIFKISSRLFSMRDEDEKAVLGKWVVILAMVNLAQFGVFVLVVNFIYGSIEFNWKDTTGSIAAGYIYSFLFMLANSFFLCCYFVVKYTILPSQEEQSRDELLNKILPSHVMNSLLKKEEPEVESYDNVTILFSDIKDFTEISTSCPPRLVTAMLNEFDLIIDYCCSMFDLYRVETIGDAYVIASGIIDGRDGASGAAAIADFAILVSHCCELVHSPVDGSPIQLRLGVHSGPVTGGVIGRSTSPRYCLFGDIVNVASREEFISEPMKIQISQATAILLMTKGLHYLGRRDSIKIKGKGLMNTYWLAKNVPPENVFLSRQLLESTLHAIRAMHHRDSVNVSILAAKKTLSVLIVDSSHVGRKMGHLALGRLANALGQEWVVTSVSTPEEVLDIFNRHVSDRDKLSSDDSSHCNDSDVSSHHLFDLIFTTQFFGKGSITGSQLMSLVHDKMVDSKRTIAIGICDESPSTTMEMLSSGFMWVWEKPLPPTHVLVERLRYDARFTLQLHNEPSDPSTMAAKLRHSKTLVSSVMNTIRSIFIDDIDDP